MTLKIHLEYVRICVSQHILYIWPQVENDKSEGGGGTKVYTFGKVSSLDCGRSLKCDATYQPQLKMLLLLHFWKELLQI